MSTNPWIQFCKDHSGQGLTRSQLSEMYKEQKEIESSEENSSSTDEDLSEEESTDELDELILENIQLKEIIKKKDQLISQYRTILRQHNLLPSTSQ